MENTKTVKRLYPSLRFAESAFVASVYFEFVYLGDRQKFINTMYFDNMTIDDAAKKLGYTK